MLQQWIDKMIVSLRRGYKHIIILLIAHLLLFTVIGMITTSKPSSRLSSSFFSSWTSNFDQSIFLTLIRMESRAFDATTTPNKAGNTLSTVVFEVMTSIKMNDVKSLLGYEIPGFSTYEHEIIIAGEGMDEMNLLSHESGPPLEDILEKRKAVAEEEEQEKKEQIKNKEDAVVFLYNSHNRESFLPHLPDVTNANLAYHEEVNITKVSERVADSLGNNGIKATVDDTDIMNVLNENGWKFNQSYAASRPVVEEALASNKAIEYVFDIHRDSLPRDKTLKTINDKDYATVMFVIGAENKQHEKNLAMATDLHYIIEELYPGLSKGIVTKEGANANGVYNQDLIEKSVLIEVGGPENTLEEMYRTADVLAESFSELYFETGAEKVNK